MSANPPEKPGQPDETDLEFLLSEYVSGTLPRARRAELERRIAEDPALREELRRYAVLERHLEDLGTEALEEVDDDVQRADVMQALERKVLLEGPPRHPFVVRRILFPLAAAAAVLIFASLGWVVLRDRPVTSQEEVAVTVLRAAPLASGSLVWEVRYQRLDWQQFHLGPPASGGPVSKLPPGTVMVSIGRSPQEEPEVLPAGFPMLTHATKTIAPNNEERPDERTLAHHRVDVDGRVRAGVSGT